MKISWIRRSEKAQARTEGVDLSLNLGINPMFPTDPKGQFEWGIWPWTAQIYIELTELTAELRCQGIKFKTVRLPTRDTPHPDWQ